MRTKTRVSIGVGIAVTSLVASVVYAAEITNVNIKEVTEETATIEWHTDVPTDGTINYGLDSAVGLVRDPAFDKKDHSLTIENLDPSTTYHFRVVSTDASGNKSATAGFVFTTQSAKSTPETQQIVDPEQRAKAEKIISELDKVTDPQAILAIGEKVKDVAGDLLRPPAIMGQPRVIAEAEYAEITWTTDRESGSMVYIASEAEYREGASDPYPIKQGDPREAVTKHKVKVIGLKPSTEYHYIVVSEDDIGMTGKSEDDTFRTKSILPTVTGVSVSRIQETSAVVNWNTGNVLAKGVVEYTNTRTKATRSMGDPVYATKHNVQLTGLEFGTRYTGTIIATNEAGDTATSKSFSFVTVRDVLPPEISKVKNESTLYPGEDTKIQTILAWETDEPSYCQVFYTQGLVRADGAEGDSLEKEKNPVALHTQVIVGFAPATVYKFWMTCNDEAGNESSSEDFVLITPVKEKNIIDIILENFEGTFGWIKNINQ